MDIYSNAIVDVWKPELEREFLDQMKPLVMVSLIDPESFRRQQHAHEDFVADWTAIKASDPDAYWAAITEWSLAAAEVYASARNVL